MKKIFFILLFLLPVFSYGQNKLFTVDGYCLPGTYDTLSITNYVNKSFCVIMDTASTADTLYYGINNTVSAGRMFPLTNLDSDCNTGNVFNIIVFNNGIRRIHYRIRVF